MNYMSPWIFTTTRCNLKCPYCYVKQDGNDMEENTYNRINDVFLSMIESGQKDYVIYRMAGGEPLLTFDKEIWRERICKCNHKSYNFIK